MANLDNLINDLDALTSPEKDTLARWCTESWGVKSAYAPVAPGIVGGMMPAPVVEPQTEWAVWLTHTGPNKVSALKEARAATGLGLKEAKALIDAVLDTAPQLVKADLPRAEAEALVAKFTAVGATAELR